MVELLKFEFYRLYKSVFAWILVGVMAVLPILAVIALSLIINYGGGDVKFSANNSQFLTWLIISYFYKWVPLVMALFAPLFVGRDYSGFIRNKMTAGHTRFQIFTSAIVSKVCYALILCLAYIIAGLIACVFSPFGVNLNGGEMLLRALTLMLSAAASTVMFSTLALIIRNRALPIIISILFVMTISNIAGLLATNFNYSHKAVSQYAELYEEKVEEYGYPTASEVDEDRFFNVGWYVGRPIALLTNAGLEDEFIMGTNGLFTSIGEDTFRYNNNISRHPFNSYTSMIISGTGYIVEEKEIKKHVDGAYVTVSQAELEYNIKSILWTAVYFGGGYMLFRKKNIF